MQKILLHLNALMDFRLAAIDAVNPNAIPEALKTHNDRLADDFEFTDCKHEDVIAALKDPEVVFPRASETPIHIFIKSTVSSAKSDYPDENWSLTLNTYPYSLLEAERAEIAEVLKDTVGMPVEVINLPYVNYNSIIRDYTLVVCYDLEWTTAIGEWLRYNPLPDLTVYTARIIPKEGLDGYKKAKGRDVFTEIELAYRPLFTLVFLPIKMYCMLTMEGMSEILEYMTIGAEANQVGGPKPQSQPDP